MYVSRDRPKRVRYWLMAPRAGELTFDAEVDAGEWFRLRDARERLSYRHDRELLDAVADAL
jgi:hypothetical protein